MPLSDFVKTSVHGSFVLEDDDGNSLTAQFELGDVAISGLSGPYLNEVVDHETRGNYISSSYGARRYPQITFSAFLTNESDASPGSIQAFLMRAAPYEDNVSTLGEGRVYAVDFTLNIQGEEFGEENWSTLFDDCVPVELSFGEAMDGDKFQFTLSAKGPVSGSLAATEI